MKATSLVQVCDAFDGPLDRLHIVCCALDGLAHQAIDSEIQVTDLQPLSRFVDSIRDEVELIQEAVQGLLTKGGAR